MNCQSIIIFIPAACFHFINKSLRFITGIHIAGCFLCASVFRIDLIDLCCHIFHCFRNIHKSVSVNFICHIDLLSLCRNFAMCSITEVNGSVSIVDRHFLIIRSCIFKTIHDIPFMIVSFSVSTYPYFNAVFLHSFKIIYQRFSIFSGHRVRICITHVTNLVCSSVADRCRLIPIIFLHCILF